MYHSRPKNILSLKDLFKYCGTALCMGLPTYMHVGIDAQVIWLLASLLILSCYVQFQILLLCEAPASNTILCLLQYKMK